MEEEKINRNDANTHIRQEKLKEINKYLNDEGVDLYDPQVMRTLLECIKVIDKRNIEFQFKCNLNIRERI